VAIPPQPEVPLVTQVPGSTISIRTKARNMVRTVTLVDGEKLGSFREPQVRTYRSVR